MKTHHSGAKYSAIVGIGEKLKQLEKENNQPYLRLNRGVPSVTNIDLTEIIPLIDFNSAEVQIYPPNSGLFRLRQAINKHYFKNSTKEDNIYITAGGMNALDLIFKTLDTKKVYLPEFYWGAYANILKINTIETDTYFSFNEVKKHLAQFKDCAIIICDPNNPIGSKYDDHMLLKLVEELRNNNTTVIWDSPYRKLFFEEDDDFYAKLIEFDNVIISESFSKSIGLSGQRLGFIHTNNAEFNEELNINILYATNGINGFAQVLVEKILSTPEGQKAAKDFRKKTVEDIQLNIKYLTDKKLLADEFYKDAYPTGIFTIVNLSEKALLDNYIGSVGLYYFTKTSKAYGEKFARICISVPHSELKTYFDKMLNQ